VTGREKEAKLKVVFGHNFKYRCQRKAVKKCKHEKASEGLLLGLHNKGRKVN
jgi:hypothetical protein